jgi:hypothetical protein
MQLSDSSGDHKRLYQQIGKYMPVAYSADNQSLYHPERDITLLCDSDWPDEIALAAELSRLAYLRAEKRGLEKKRS